MCALVTGVQTGALPISIRVARLIGEAECRNMGGGGIEHGHPIRVRETNHYRCPPSPRTAGQPLMTIFPVAWSPAAGARSSRKGLPSSVVPTRPLPFVVSERPAGSAEHTSELQSPMRISVAVFCLTK